MSQLLITVAIVIAIIAAFTNSLSLMSIAAMLAIVLTMAKLKKDKE